MNKDQVKGKAKSIAGRVQERTGKLIGSRQQQVKGIAKQISGNLQESLGDIRQSEANLAKR